MRIKKIVIFLLFTTLKINAQYIEGQVLERLDDSTTSPIFQANVFWEGTTIGTITDQNGSTVIVSNRFITQITLNLSN